MYRPSVITPIQHAREAVLKKDLQTMREAIDTYTFDKEKPPFRLQELVDASYLRHIPVDPITETTDWRIHLADVKTSPMVVINGIDDVSSNSTKTGTDHTPYDTW